MTYFTENITIDIPITEANRQTALQFARQQPTSEKACQVYLNTLAVLVMSDYFQLLDFPTDLKASYSWNPVGRLCGDMADLMTEVGHLECRPIRAGAKFCSVPPDVWEDRIGYAVVQLDEACRTGTILGFVPTVTETAVAVSQLRSLDMLLAHLERQRAAVGSEQPESRSLVNLSQWLLDVFEPSWHEIEEILNSRQTFAFRHRHAADYSSGLRNAVPSEPDAANSHVARVKRIDLGIQLADRSVALLVELEPKADETLILLQVHPTGSIHLPSGLQLSVLDEAGATLRKEQARSADNYIQLQFSAELGEQFGVRVALGQASIIEHFKV